MLESKDIANAKTVLVFATDISTDILRSWEQLANIYVEENNKANIHILIKKSREHQNLPRSRYSPPSKSNIRYFLMGIYPVKSNAHNQD